MSLQFAVNYHLQNQTVWIFSSLCGFLVTQTLPEGHHRKNSSYCIMPQGCYKNTLKSPKQPSFCWVLVITLCENIVRKWKLTKQWVVSPLKDGRWSVQHLCIRHLIPKLCTENSFHSQSPGSHITSVFNLAGISTTTTFVSIKFLVQSLNKKYRCDITFP